MCAQDHHAGKPNFLLSILQNKCPRCRTGRFFKYRNPYNLRHFMEMKTHCDVCGQPSEPETGFYFGTGYVSYALSVAISVASFIAWWVLIGLSVNDNRLFWWIGVNAVLLIVLQPLIMRLSRIVWLSFFVHYEPGLYSEKVAQG